VGAAKFEVRIRELVEGFPDLAVLIEPLLIVRRVLREQIGILHQRVLTVVTAERQNCQKFGTGDVRWAENLRATMPPQHHVTVTFQGNRAPANVAHPIRRARDGAWSTASNHDEKESRASVRWSGGEAVASLPEREAIA
jgi:hypothetical protein